MIYQKCGGGYVYEIPLSEIERIEYIYGENGNEKIDRAFSRVTEKSRTPDFLINAELFDFTTRKPASDVVSGGKVHRLTDGYGIAFPDNKSAVFSYKNNVNAPDYIGAYPVLIRNGKDETTIPNGIGGSRGRTAIGVGKNNLYLALVPDGYNDLTLDELRKAFLNVGATDAINLDGGGSTQYYTPINKHITGRNVRGFIGIWLTRNNDKTNGKEAQKMTTVFLSAGHGGTDPGAVALGLKEKNINLQMLLGCKAELERHNVKVVCSRVKDENDRKEEEVREANASGAEIAVSFHNNAGGGDGFEAYYYTKSPKSKKLAQLGEKHIKALGQNSRGIKSGNDLYFINSTKAPAVLFESFFLDNDKDNDIGDTVAEQKAFGVAYAKAILEYLGIAYKAPTSAAPATKPTATKTDSSFKVKTTASSLRIRKGPGTNYASVGTTKPNVYTITEVKSGTGSVKGWGKLKSGAGWISLDYATRL